MSTQVFAWGLAVILVTALLFIVGWFATLMSVSALAAWLAGATLYDELERQ